MKPLSQALAWLARPVLQFYSVLGLMLLLVAGTLAQADIGLYEAEQRYFAAFIIWVYGVPLPAAYTWLAVIALNLTAKMILATEWTWRKAGINITHVGVMVLMVGALLTALTSHEGYMIIPEGSSNSIVSDYHARELVAQRENTIIDRWPFEALYEGKTLNIDGQIVEVMTLCRHCGLLPDGGLAALPLRAEDEENVAGVSLHLGEAVYHTYETMPEPPLVDGVKLIMQRVQYEVPFRIALKRFDRVMHKGTRLPEQYTSYLEVHEDGVSWPVTITMNAPLRHAGYTFYQSSYLNIGGREATVLSVVRNQGQWFPYIASGIIALGLLIHWLLRVVR
jgi:hypothetical protein